MTVEVYTASEGDIILFDGHSENGRVLKFAEANGVRYISLSTPGFFPSIMNELMSMNKTFIEANSD